MSNRSDFDALSGELAVMFGWPPHVRARVEIELHNAYVAALEGAPCGCRWCLEEKREGNATPWLAPGEQA